MTAAEKPILFSTPMVRAILERRKTETRRPVTSRWHGNHPITHVCRFSPDKWTITGRGQTYERCPYGKPGDLLYVRESYARNYNGPGRHGYAADWTDTAADVVPRPRWTPSIHMPKAAARIWLPVESVSVERLRDITEEGAKAEGFACRGDFISELMCTYPDLRLDGWVWVVRFSVESTTGRST